MRLAQWMEDGGRVHLLHLSRRLHWIQHGSEHLRSPRTSTSTSWKACTLVARGGRQNLVVVMEEEEEEGEEEEELNWR